LIRLVRTTVRAKLKVAEDYYRVIRVGFGLGSRSGPTWVGVG